MPTPPMRAMAMAIRASVTVSIAADTSGTLNRMFRDSCEEVSTSLGTMSDSSGKSSTSSKVMPRVANFAGRPGADSSLAIRAMRLPSRQESTEGYGGVAPSRNVGRYNATTGLKDSLHDRGAGQCLPEAGGPTPRTPLKPPPEATGTRPSRYGAGRVARSDAPRPVRG